MSQNQLPSSSELSGWSPEKLADFLRKRKLQGCDRTVLLHHITGDRFLNLTNSDLDKFPKTYNPLISKLIADIQKQKSGKRRFFGFGQPKPLQPVEVESEDGGWGRDEFDDSDDGDYAEPQSSDEDQSDYEEPSDDPGPGQAPSRTQSWTQDQDSDQDQDYEPPPSEPDELVPRLPCGPVAEGSYIGGHVTSRGPPPTLCPRPPQRPTESRRDCSPRPRALPSQPPPVCRVNKPGRDPGSNQSPNRGALRSTQKKPLPQTLRSPPEPESQSLAKPPVAMVTRSNSGARVPMNRFKLQAEPVPEDDFKHSTFPLHNKSMRPSVTCSLPPGLPPGLPSGLPPGLPSAPRFSGGAAAVERPAPKQDLDSLWYVGKVTRAEAEATLQRLGKDGAFVVRDSSRLSAHQPFTLMVQFQHKVYNIQIQRQDHKYLLGTGLKVQESFSSVRDMVDHFSQSPLILIDSKNRDSSLHSECLLSAPAGPYIDRV